MQNDANLNMISILDLVRDELNPYPREMKQSSILDKDMSLNSSHFKGIKPVEAVKTDT
jgi:hypothetical protein